MGELVAGQNSELGSSELTFSVSPARVELAALVLDDQRRALPNGYVYPSGPAQHAGVDAAPGQVSINLDALTAGVERILCVALDPQPGTAALTCTLTDSQGQNTAFTVLADDVHPAVIAFELYRRAAQWKVRAIGQGYANGAPEMARLHGISADAAPRPAVTTAPQQPRAQTGRSEAAVPITPLGDQDPLERIAMIYEDAARSTAALMTAHEFADNRRDSEMSSAVADPATRNTAAGQHALHEAQRRYDELISAATADYQRDATHLIAEVDELDGQLPSALASWAAPAWQQPPRPTTGIRLGVLTMPEAGPLAVPFCIPTPLRRPLWIDTRESAAVTPVVASLLIRLVAAAPPTIIDVIDLADALEPLTRYLTAHMPRPSVTSHTSVVERLQHLVTLTELAALRDDPHTTGPAGSILVITDPGYGFPPEAVQSLVQLINNSGPASLSVLFVGDHADAAGSAMPLMQEIAEFSHHIQPHSEDSAVLDPWTQQLWRFVPDTVTPGPRLADLIGMVDPTADPPNPW